MTLLDRIIDLQLVVSFPGFIIGFGGQVMYTTLEIALNARRRETSFSDEKTTGNEFNNFYLSAIKHRSYILADFVNNLNNMSYMKQLMVRPTPQQATSL